MHVRQNDALSRFLRRMEEQLRDFQYRLDRENQIADAIVWRTMNAHLLEDAPADEDALNVSIPDDGWYGTGPLEAYSESFDDCDEIPGFDSDLWASQDWPEVLA